MMDNINFDRRAALEILRGTVKVAAAPAVGIGGPSPQEPGPLTPGGGGTVGGSNNPQMQSGWAAGSMRKSLIKKFTANASKQQAQSVNVAATKQVGGMGSGMPKMASIGRHLEKRANFLGAARRFGGAVKSGFDKMAPHARNLYKKYKSYTAPKPPQIKDVATQSVDDLLRHGDLKPGTKDEIGNVIRDKLGNLIPAPKGFKTYQPPAKASRLNPRRYLEGGEGLSNIYKNPDTGHLIKGQTKGRGLFPKAKAPKDYKLEKRWHNTGGVVPRTVKRAPLAAGGGGAVGYGSSFYDDPGDFSTLKKSVSTVANPNRWRKARAGAKGGLSVGTYPGAAAGALSPAWRKSFGEDISVPRVRLQRERKKRLRLPDTPTGGSRSDILRREAEKNYWGKPQ